MFAHARPGTSDTSAIPTDQVNNPGTMNAIINIEGRPTFPGEIVNKWRKVETLRARATRSCWCEPGATASAGRRGAQTETVHHILKGGEDSIGALEAIQRVYFNIGSCSEQCWVNHLTDLRQVDPQGRNFGQTPFNIGQCRRDCPNFRAIEDRLPNILDFLHVEGDRRDRPRQGRGKMRAQGRSRKAVYTAAELERDLDKQFGTGAVARGREVFAANCARCHSSIPGNRGRRVQEPRLSRAGTQTACVPTGWASDQATLASEVGTIRCRALHSNHMTGHVWERVRFGDAARARARSQHQGAARRRARLLSQHLAACRPGRTRRSCTTTRSGRSSAASRRTRPTTSTAPPTSMRTARRSLPTRRRRAGRTTRASTGASSCTSPRWRSCSIRANASPRCRASIRTCRLRWARASGTARKKSRCSASRSCCRRAPRRAASASFQHKEFVNDIVLAKLQPAELNAKLVKQFGETQGKQVAEAAERGHERDRQGPGAPGRDDPPISAARRDLQLVHRLTSRTRAIASARTCPTATRRR